VYDDGGVLRSKKERYRNRKKQRERKKEKARARERERERVHTRRKCMFVQVSCCKVQTEQKRQGKTATERSVNGIHTYFVFRVAKWRETGGGKSSFVQTQFSSGV